MTKQQKIYGAILSLVAGAWLIDRFLPDGGVTSPASAEASGPPAVHPDNPPRPAASASSAKTADSLGDRLAQYAQAQSSSTQKALLDAFTPPADWIAPAPAPAPAPVVAVVAAAPPPFDVEQFRREHKLNAVIRSAEGNAIIMDGSIVHLGQEVGGLLLMDTSPVSATFRGKGAAGVVVILKLSDPGMGKPGTPIR